MLQLAYTTSSIFYECFTSTSDNKVVTLPQSPKNHKAPNHFSFAVKQILLLFLSAYSIEFSQVWHEDVQTWGVEFHALFVFVPDNMSLTRLSHWTSAGLARWWGRWRQGRLSWPPGEGSGSLHWLCPPSKVPCHPGRSSVSAATLQTLCPFLLHHSDGS